MSSRKLVSAGLFAGWILLQPVPGRAQASSFNISTYAGSTAGTAGSTGDGQTPTNALLNQPVAVALDASGNLYIADSGNHKIRKISGGKIGTVAGNGTPGYGGDGGSAVNANLNIPYGVRVDGSGNLYIADLANDVVRRVDGKSGNISTFAGVNGSYGYFANQDGGPASRASLDQPVGLAYDAAGNIYIGDSHNDRVRYVDPNGNIHTLAGANQWQITPGSSPWTSYGGDGGPAIAATLYYPSGVAVDAAGNVYIADSQDNRVRKVTPNGIITTVAGTGIAGFSGDGGPAVNAQLNRPWDVAVDAAGDLYISDYGNHRIRLVDASGNITTVAGSTGYGYSGDGGAATSAKLNYPTGIALDPANGNLYIADSSNNVIRVLTPTAPSIDHIISASGYGGFHAAAPGSWIEIYGTNLAFNRRTWTTADFQGAKAPTALDNVSVTIGGQPAYVYYISGTQISALVPMGVGTGQQPVVVKNAAGQTAAFNITVNATEPGLLAPTSFNISGTPYVVALATDLTTFILPPGAIPGITSERAKPGQTIVLYGIGFGPVSPAAQDGQIVSQSSTLATPLQVSIGGQPAQVTYQGLVQGDVGLYQFNVVVPQVPAGDKVPLTFTLGGTPGTQTLYVAIG